MPFLVRDGVRIFYADDGTGASPLVLVHGWCCDRTFLEPQARYFAPRHRVIAVDLPGHGLSDKPARDYAIPVLADDVAWLCRRLDLVRPVIVGHSLGGAIALELAAHRSESIAAAVVLDTAVAPTAEIRHNWAQLIEQLRGPHYRAAAGAAIEQSYFLPTDDPVQKTRILAVMTAAPQHVALSGMQGIADWDSEGVAAGARVPVLNISSSAPHTDIARFRALCPHLVHGQVVGAGHFIPLMVPDQVNAMIARFLTLILG